jgi:uncharacterized protein YjeT (DUF2065 family)
MKWFLYAIGFFWIGLGVCFILYTETCRQMAAEILDAVHEKILALIALAIGFLLILSAFWSENVWFIMLLGVMVTVKGVLLLFNPKNMFETIKNWYLNGASDRTYRFFGIIMLIVGTAVSWWT